MKVVRVFAFGFLSLCLLALAALFIQGQWLNSHRIMPGPENQSSFLKGYDPEEVIKRFRVKGWGSGGGHGSGAASPGTQSIEQTADFEPWFPIESSRKIELMTALSDDVSCQLALAGARVLGKGGEPDGGFKYEYTSGNSVGSISVHPPGPADIRRNLGLPGGLEDITLKIELKETWTRPASR